MGMVDDMKILINDIESYRSPESIQVSVDDRVEKIPIINGNCVQDYGHISSGDTIEVSALFHEGKVDEIAALWENRTLVSFTDDAGIVWENCRIVVKSYKRDQNFKNYILLNFEVWRV